MDVKRMGWAVLTGMVPERVDGDQLHGCPAMTWALAPDNRRSNFAYNPVTREYAVVMDPDAPPRWWSRTERGDKGDEVIVLAFCPFDGEPLPRLLVDEWFAAVEAADGDPYEGQDLPLHLRSAQWWIQAGL